MNSGTTSEQRKLEAELTPQPQSTSIGIYFTETSPSDVLLGRGVNLSKYKGNVEFRCLIQSKINEYVCAKSIGHKNRGEISHEIYTTIISRKGRFLRRVKTLDERKKLKIPASAGTDYVWVPVQKEVAIKKIKQALRDCERGDQSNNCNEKLSLETVSAIEIESTTNARISNSYQRSRFLSNNEVVEHPSLNAVTTEDNLQSLIAQTLQRYQQEASAPLSSNEITNTILSIPYQAINATTLQIPARSPPREFSLHQHSQTSEISHSSNTSEFPYLNNYMEVLDQSNFIDNLTPSFSNNWQSHLGNLTMPRRVLQGTIDFDTTTPIQQQELNLSLENPSQSIINQGISPHSTFQITESQDRISQVQSLNVYQGSPSTTLQQHMLSLPLLTNRSMIIQQYLMYDQMNNFNGHNNMSDRRGAGVPMYLSQSDSMYLHILPQSSATISSSIPAATRHDPHSNLLLPQPVMHPIYTTDGRAVASLPFDPLNTDDDCNNNHDHIK